MTQYTTFEEMEVAAQLIRSRTSHAPKIGLILGSGLSDLADSIENADIIPSAEIPYWPGSTVEGHKGRVVIG
ncbi:MAG: purine-nucleoside phosphorylase, partial [Chloroflexota bacterium]